MKINTPSISPLFQKIFVRVCPVVFVALFVGCASPQLAPKTVSHRSGFFDRLAKMTPSYQSHSMPGEMTAEADSEENSESEEQVDSARLPQSLRKKGKHAKVVKNYGEGVAGLMWPLSQIRVTSRFGKRGRRYHDGVDLRAPIGTPVFASQSGRVLYSDRKIRGYGKMVVIRHQGELATVYAHNSKLLVRRGQKVRRGQLIAYSGITGHARGPHLHFEVRRGSEAVNPLKVLSTRPSTELASIPDEVGRN